MPPDPQSLAAIILTVCWIVFICFWSITAFFTKRTVFQQSASGALAYRAAAILGALFVFNARRFPQSLGRHFVQPTDGLAWLAAALGVIGVGVCLWARVTLGSNWSSVVMVKEHHELVQRGPYRYVRHPIYTGLLALFAGTVLLGAYRGGIIGEALLFLSFWIKLRHEETLMLKEFPNDYPAYMRRVKRLVPFLF